MKCKVKWINRLGKYREHTIWTDSEFGPKDWWRRSILECQGILTKEERRNSRLEYLGHKVISLTN